MKNFRSNWIVCLLSVLIAAAVITTGCSSRKTTTVSTTEVHRDPEVAVSRYDGEHTVEVTRREEVTQDDGHKGFFGIVGDIIALPFRAIGSIL